MQFWNELEGQVLEGIYPLHRLVRSEGRTAWFETEIHDKGVRPAIISLTESLTDADEVTNRLQAAQRLDHPNLVAIYKVSQAYLDQTLFVYAIMEHVDQNLADILRDQALSPQEARQVAEAMAGGLTAIHQQGMVHGRVEPASMVAVGEAVKLRSDCLQSPGGTRAKDVAGIGATLFEAFTQRKPTSAEDDQINRLPAPFAEIVSNSLSARWSLSQVVTALWPNVAPPAATTAVARPANPARTTTGPQPLPPQPPVQPAAPAAPEKVQENEEEIEKSSRPTAVYAAIVVALLVILGWLLFRPKPQAPPHPAAGISTPPAAPSQSPRPAALPAAPSTASAKPPASRPAAKARPTAQGEAAAAAERPIWRVVAYTYRRQDQAQHKVDEINSGHSGLEASVLSPQGDPNHYLVVIGGAMDQRQAFQMRAKALSAGLPADTYVQNFAE